MSHIDHEWAKEQIAAHLAGGLNAEERARLEAHAASCAECIAELDAARRFDRQMDDLFAPVRAKAGMEERIIQRLRFAPVEKQRSPGAKGIFAAAALILSASWATSSSRSTKCSPRRSPPPERRRARWSSPRRNRT